MLQKKSYLLVVQKKIHLVYLPSDLYYPYSEKQHPYLLFF